MNLVKWLQKILVGFGAAWVMWLMIGLSVLSLAIILERLWFFRSLRDDLVALARDLQSALSRSIDEAKDRMRKSPSAEAAVVLAGLEIAPRGAAAADEAMKGALALQRMKLDRGLAYLGTLGNNAPFIGLLGTVIGIVGAFEAIGSASKTPGAQQSAAPPETVMFSIAEALVATAIGLAVAIPAVAFYNYFQRVIKSTLANTEALTRVLLAHLKGTPLPASGPDLSQGNASDDEEPAAEEKPAKAKASLKKSERGG